LHADHGIQVAICMLIVTFKSPYANGNGLLRNAMSKLQILVVVALQSTMQLLSSLIQRFKSNPGMLVPGGMAVMARESNGFWWKVKLIMLLENGTCPITPNPKDRTCIFCNK